MVASPKAKILRGRYAAFFPRGHAVPKVPAGLTRIDRPEGTLVTSHGGKAAQFQNAPTLSHKMIADMLGYQESKPQVRQMLAGGTIPAVVQGVTPKGAVVHEEAVSPQNVTRAANTARAAAPGGHVRVTGLRDAIMRRMMR